MSSPQPPYSPGQQPSGASLYPPTPSHAGGARSGWEPQGARPHRAGLGAVALLLSLVALVGGAVVLGACCFAVGLQAGASGFLESERLQWSLLAPVRSTVLVGEIAAWSAVALGIWALAQGIVAIVRRRGRGMGIAAVVIAVLAPLVVGTIAAVTFLLGVGAGIDPGAF